MRAKQTKVCDAERAGFHTPIFILVTSRQRRVITHASNYLQTDGQLKLAAASLRGKLHLDGNTQFPLFPVTGVTFIYVDFFFEVYTYFDFPNSIRY